MSKTEPAHGTYTMYGKRGCRCAECREGQRARVARNRAERLAAGRLTHGTRSAYDAGCRCQWCKAERRAASAGVDKRSQLRRMRAKRLAEAQKSVLQSSATTTDKTDERV